MPTTDTSPKESPKITPHVTPKESPKETPLSGGEQNAGVSR